MNEKEQSAGMSAGTMDFLARVIPMQSLQSFYSNPANQAAFEAWDEQRKKEKQSD